MNRLLNPLRLPCLLLCACILAVPLQAAEVIELNRIVAVVNEDAITRLELDKRLKGVEEKLLQTTTSLPPREILRRQLLEHLIIERLQLELARERGIQVDDEALNEVIVRIAEQNRLTPTQFREVLAADGIEFADFREDIRSELIMNNLRAREVESRVDVSPHETDELLLRLAASGEANTEYHLGHILIALPEAASPEQVQEARGKTTDILRQLDEGADFHELAITHSAGQQALQGGDLGWRTGGQLPTLFADSVLRMSAGELSEPLRSSSGFHIIKLIDKRGEQTEYITQTHARHILVRSTALVSDAEAREKLLRLRERILQGEDFAELAQANSEDPGSGAGGGDLGWANPGTFVSAFEEAMDQLQPGEISLPFESEFGWHILQVLKRRQHDGTDEIKRARAHETIRQRKIEEETENWLRQLRDEAYVEYME